MKRLLGAVLLSGTVAAESAATIEALGLKWRVPSAGDWKIDAGDRPVLHLLTPRPALAPRRPVQYALAETTDYLKFTLELEVRKEPLSARNRRTSLMLVYAWKDAAHFNYAHLSVDTGREAPVHNGIFHVFGGERVRISSLDGPAALSGEDWHQVKLVYDGTAGRVDVWVNGRTSPSMRAVDMSLGAGKFGIGSFFDMGSFRNVRITGVTQ